MALGDELRDLVATYREGQDTAALKWLNEQRLEVRNAAIDRAKRGGTSIRLVFPIPPFIDLEHLADLAQAYAAQEKITITIRDGTREHTVILEVSWP